MVMGLGRYRAGNRAGHVLRRKDAGRLYKKTFQAILRQRAAIY